MLTKVLEFRHSDKDLISATHACRIWRYTLLSTPLLWTEVKLGDPNRTSTYLERSKSAPLHVSVVDAADNSYEFIVDMSWFGRTASLHILADHHQIESIGEELCLPAPILQSLVITGRAYPTNIRSSVRIPPSFLGQQAPFLRSLTFESVSPTPVTNLPLQNITSFEWTDETAVVTIEEVLTLLTSATLVETLELFFLVQPTTEAVRGRSITLPKLNNLWWTNYGGHFSLMPLLVAPELKDSTIQLSSCPGGNLSAILPPHRDHFPLLAEPTALRYTCQNFDRVCNFTYTNGSLEVRQVHNTSTTGPPSDRWLSSNTSISFKKTKHLTVEGFGGYPLPGDIPIEQFESLEGLELTGEVDCLLHIMRPNRIATSEVLSVPFPSLLELRLTFCESDFPLLAKVLKERKEAGHGVKTILITGVYHGWSSKETSELARLVDSVTKID